MDGLNHVALKMWQDKLNWIRERYNYLVVSKIELQEWMDKQVADYPLSTHQGRIEAMRNEINSIDAERTMIYETKLKLPS